MDRIANIRDFPALPARAAEAHKGSFGRVLVVGGSRRMIGAPGLTANAALRAGAGLVTVASPAPVQLAVAMLCECATSIPLAVDTTAQLAPEAVAQFRKAADTVDTIAMGPGLAVGPMQQQLVGAGLDQEKPLVLDADGLNNLAKLADWPAGRRCPLVLTPHPGEMGRLIGREVGEVQADREAIAIDAHAAWTQAGKTEAELVLVLKGAGTVVTDGRRVYVNDTGNPGLATGGTGDVLTGLLAGLAAQAPDLFTASAWAAWLHGRAGDLAAEQLTEQSLIATDLLETIPQAMAELLAG